MLVPILFALALPVHAATVTIPSAGVTINVENAVNCDDGSALVCITTLQKQREFLLGYSDDDAFLGATYRVLLHRAIDTAGLVYYSNRLSAHTITRNGVIDSIVASPEYSQ
jgi:hypothetical protein